MKSPPGEKFVDLCCALCETRSPPKQQWLQETRESLCSSVWNGNHAVEELPFFFPREIFSQEFPPPLAHLIDQNKESRAWSIIQVKVPTLMFF